MSLAHLIQSETLHALAKKAITPPTCFTVEAHMEYIKALWRDTPSASMDALRTALVSMMKHVVVPLPVYQEWASTLSGLTPSQLLEILHWAVVEHQGNIVKVCQLIMDHSRHLEVGIPSSEIYDKVVRYVDYSSADAKDVIAWFRTLPGVDLRKSYQDDVRRGGPDYASTLEEYIEWDADEEVSGGFKAEVLASTLAADAKHRAKYEKDITATRGRYANVWLEYILWEYEVDHSRAIALTERACATIPEGAQSLWVHQVLMVRSEKELAVDVNAMCLRGLHRFPRCAELWWECIAGWSGDIEPLLTLARGHNVLSILPSVLLALCRRIIDAARAGDNNRPLLELAETFLMDSSLSDELVCQVALLFSIRTQDHKTYFNKVAAHRPDALVSLYRAKLEYGREYKDLEIARKVHAGTLRSALIDKQTRGYNLATVRFVETSWLTFESLYGAGLSTWIAAVDSIRLQRQTADLKRWCGEVGGHSPAVPAAVRIEAPHPPSPNPVVITPLPLTPGLYLCNLPVGTTPEEVTAFLAPCALACPPVTAVKKNQTIARVTMLTREGAREALATKDQALWNGQKVRVQPLRDSGVEAKRAHSNVPVPEKKRPRECEEGLTVSESTIRPLVHNSSPLAATSTDQLLLTNDFFSDFLNAAPPPPKAKTTSRIPRKKD